jgi:hypothetical protein
MFDLQIARTKQRELRNESCDYVILNHAFHPGRGLGAARRAHGGQNKAGGQTDGQAAIAASGADDCLHEK